MTIAEKGGRRAKHAVVVQRLHDRDSLFIGRIVDGGRDHRKSVMDMNDVRRPPVHEGAKLGMDLLVPDGIAEQDQAVLAVYLIVAGPVKKYFMAMRSQQIGLLGEDLILTTGVLIRVVHGKDFHGFKWPACPGWRV